jgi:hypothetical protein
MKLSLMVFSLCLLVAGCGEYAAKGAGEGATTGAVSGAVGGLVSALVFGGDPGEAAARGAVYGGATGATVGAMAGSKVDAKIAEQRKAKAEEIRGKIGDDAFKGLSALMRCDYQDSLNNAARAKQSKNPNFAVSGYWLEALTYADQGDSTRVASLMPTLVEKDWDIDSKAAAQANLTQLQDKLMQIREEYKLPKKCEISR